MAKKMMGGKKMGSASGYSGAREDGSSGQQRNSQHERKVAKTPGGDIQKGRSSPKGARN